MPSHLSEKMKQELARHHVLPEDAGTMLTAMRTNKIDALHDQLTGLANRRKLESELEKYLTREHKRAEKLFVMYMDLNKFKQINDTYGHSIGDNLLKNTSKHLKEALRPDDILSRLGGDEFVALISLSDSASEEQIRDELAGITERLERAVYTARCELRDELAGMTGLSNNPPLVVGEQERYLSAGFTEVRSDDTASELLHRADAEMYKMKHGGSVV